MRVAIVSINYAPEPTGISVYSTGMAEYLAERGCSVRVHTGFSYYPNWSKARSDWRVLFRRATDNGVDVRRSYLYVPARPTALRRMLHEISFVASASLAYLFAPHADVTIIVSPPLALGLPIALLARLKGSVSIVHVQDLQPDAAVDLGMLRPGRLTRLLYRLERATYAAADRVSSISEGMRQRIIAKGVAPERTFILRNWANDEAVTALPHAAGLAAEWGLQDKFIVLYSGNLGIKQGLDSLLEAAALLRDERAIAFVIVGDGGEKHNLVKHVETHGLTNVHFRAPVVREDLGRMLATADVSVIPQRAGIHDVVLPSKFGNILCSKRPLVAMAEEDSELAQLILNADCGAIVPPGDSQGLATALLAVRDQPARAAARAENGVRFVRERLTRRGILEPLFVRLESFVKSGGGLPPHGVSTKTHPD